MVRLNRRQAAILTLVSTALLVAVVLLANVSAKEVGVACNNWANMCWYDCNCTGQCWYFPCCSDICWNVPYGSMCGICAQS